MIEIKKVADWKKDYLELFSDMHKDAYGFRPRNHGWMFDIDTSMEEVMDEYHRVWEAVSEECAREEKAHIRRGVAKRVHTLMIMEANTDPKGIVFVNPEWCEWCENDPHYAEYMGIEQWCFYIPKKVEAPKMKSIFGG